MKLFANHEKTQLEALLARAADPDDTLTVDAVHGFFYGLAIIPEAIPPSEWLPGIFGEKMFEIDSEAEAEKNLTPLFEAYNRFIDKANKGQLAFPFDMENLKVGDLGQMDDWTVGFFTAISLRKDIWMIPEDENALTEEQKELSNCFAIVMGIALPEELPGIFPTEKEGTQEEIDQLYATLFGLLPIAVERIQEYAETGSLDLPPEDDDWIRSEPVHHEKIGRNAPCPCGSGKKYKKCCGK